MECGWNGDFIEGLLRGEDGVMGSLEARGVAEGDRTSFCKPSSSIYFLVAPHGGFVLRSGVAPGWH